MRAGTLLLLVGTGVAAGLSGSIAGPPFSYPALLVVGLRATAANADPGGRGPTRRPPGGPGRRAH